MKIKKKDLVEAKFMVKADDYEKIKDDVEADDSVTVIDEDSEVKTVEDIQSDGDAMYVQYDKPYSDEEPFTVQDEKFEYCWGIYPSGKRDIAVYAYAGDVCYGYRWWRKTYLRLSEGADIKAIIKKDDLIKFIKENKTWQKD